MDCKRWIGAAALLAGATVVLVALDSGVARAGAPPTITAVVETVDTATGQGALLVSAKKISKYARSASVRDLTGALIAEAEVFFTSKDLLGIRLPAELAPGDYRLLLEPKRGPGIQADFAYQTHRFSFPAGHSVGVGTTSPLATLDVNGTLVVQDAAQFLDDLATIGSVEIEGGLDVADVALFGADVDVAGTLTVDGEILTGGRIEHSSQLGGIVLEPFLDDVAGHTVLATLSSTIGAAARLRFERAPNADGFEVGQNLAGSFVIDDLAGSTLFELRTAGAMVLGADGGSHQVFVNSPPLSNGTMVIRARTGDVITFGVREADGDEVLRVAGQDLQILQGDVGVSAGDVIVTAGKVQLGSGDVELGTGDLVIAAGDAFKPGGGSFGVVSDARLKKDVRSLRGALDTLAGLRGVTFEYRDPAAVGQLPGRQTGLIAQEVERVLPEWVGERADGVKFVAPRGFEALVATALRELRAEKDAEIAALRSRLADLEDRAAADDVRLRRLERALLGDQGADGRAADGAPDER